jgi:hypothetical protein
MGKKAHVGTTSKTLKPITGQVKPTQLIYL